LRKQEKMAERSELYVNRERMYAVTVDSEGIKYLEVVCGGIAMENVVVRLTAQEVSLYEARGAAFLDQLAARVAKRRDQFLGRIVP
jgi:hypothetical protein